MNKLERFFLSNQLRIMEALYPDEADGFAVQREAVEQGYSFIYDNMFMEHIYDGNDAMTRKESEEVWNVMDMFLSIDRSIKDLGLEEFHKDYSNTFFQGYDGNNEGKFMGFAAFTVERLGRFTHLPLKEKFYFNSHSPMRKSYGAMLSVWQNIDYKNRWPMSKDDLQQVLDAPSHPKNAE